ncbi:MAG: type II secretion system protein GspF, partial [Leptolyngbya sp. PLA1]|nr:type II secretion system protein GspF [Leptolyngbya sp. PLA1]
MSALAFQYRATDGAGNRSRGTIVAATRDAALARLRASGLTPLEVALAHRTTASSTPATRIAER